jgi:POT family proton-dependent oligopeptide transporter
MVPDAAGGQALATDPAYAKLFGQLGWSSTIVGVVLLLLIPFLRRLIKDRQPPEAAPASAAVTS